MPRKTQHDQGSAHALHIRTGKPADGFTPPGWGTDSASPELAYEGPGDGSMSTRSMARGGSKINVGQSGAGRGGYRNAKGRGNGG